MRYWKIFVRLIIVLSVSLIAFISLYYLLILILKSFFDVKSDEIPKLITAVAIPFWVSIIAYFKDGFQNYILSPDLTVGFELKEPYVTLCDLSVDGRKVGKAHCIKLLIRNMGVKIAKNCYVVIHDRGNDKSFQSLSLSWANWKGMYRDIYDKSDGVFIDLIRLDNQSSQYPHFCFYGTTPGQDVTQYVPNSQDSMIYPDEVCDFRITVYSENADPITRKVVFKWNGGWDDDFRKIVEISLKR